MQGSHQVTEQKYEIFRAQSREIAEKTLPSDLKGVVGLTSITSHALAQAKQWEDSSERPDDATWSWSEGTKQYCYSHPKRFDLAVWYAKAQLCGLSIGKPTYSGSGMRLDIIEGAPNVHPLKRRVVPISIAAFETYADLIGATQLRIMRPLNNDLVRYYERHDFTFKQGKASNTPTYLWKNL